MIFMLKQDKCIINIALIEYREERYRTISKPHSLSHTRSRTELQNLFTKYFPTLNINLIFMNKFTISSFFRFKDSLPPMSRSSVVYKYSCPLCGDQYVRSTSRTLFVRASEHGGRSHRTGALLTCPPHSAIRDHCEQTCLGPVSYDDFNILAVAPDLVSLRILESLHIFKSKPKLNDNNSSFPLNIVL